MGSEDGVPLSEPFEDDLAAPQRSEAEDGAHARPSDSDLLSICGRTITFILAPNEESGNQIEEALRAARRSEVAAIFVLADFSCAEAALDAVRNLHRKGRTMMQAVEFDFAQVYGDATDISGFHLEELPLNMVQAMRALSESVLDVYESILIIDATQEIPNYLQLYDLCFRLRMHFDDGEVFVRNDAAPSPYIMSRSYIEGLVEGLGDNAY